MRADPNGPKFAKPHPKGESIWHKQHQEPYEKANLSDYPGNGDEILAWKEGNFNFLRISYLLSFSI